MKNMLKTGLRLLGFVLLALGAQAQSIKPFVLTNGVNLVLNAKAAVDEINITDSSGYGSTLLILDNSSALSTNTVKPSYISYAYSKATNSTTFTNIAGVVQTNSFVYLSRSATTNAAATNVANILYRTTIPASGTVTIVPDTSFGFGFGVQMLLVGNTTNTPSAAGTLFYSPLP